MRFFSIIIAALLIIEGTAGQSLTGTIRDLTGAPIPGASIRLTNTQTGISIDTQGNEAGLYRATALPPGNYQVEVQAPGFKLLRREVALQVGQVLALDLTLQVGEQNETVNVVESASAIESQSSQITQAVTRQMLSGLPRPRRWRRWRREW